MQQPKFGTWKLGNMAFTLLYKDSILSGTYPPLVLAFLGWIMVGGTPDEYDKQIGFNPIMAISKSTVLVLTLEEELKDEFSQLVKEVYVAFIEGTGMEKHPLEVAVTTYRGLMHAFDKGLTPEMLLNPTEADLPRILEAAGNDMVCLLREE
jgi:hypothetical protein